MQKINNSQKEHKEYSSKFEQGRGTIIIPTIVLAELLYLCERKKKQELLSEVVQKIKGSINYVTYDLDIDVILECKSLEKIPEMHDKIITATARILKACIITKDPVIVNSGYTDTVW